MIRFILVPFLILALASCATKEPQPITQMDMNAIQFPSDTVQKRIDLIVPYAVRNNRRLQAHALKVGKPLSAEAMALARELGVKNPEKIRIVIVNRIPKANTAEKLISATPLMSFTDKIVGIASGYGIYLDKEFAGRIWVLAHELVHVAQFERLGLEGLTRQVVTEQLVLPGRLIPIEREAITKSAEVLGIEPPAYAF